MADDRGREGAAGKVVHTYRIHTYPAVCRGV